MNLLPGQGSAALLSLLQENSKTYNHETCLHTHNNSSQFFLMQQLLLISLYQPQGAWKKPFIFEIISDFCVCSSRWPLFGGSYPFTATIAKSSITLPAGRDFNFLKYSLSV